MADIFDQVAAQTTNAGAPAPAQPSIPSGGDVFDQVASQPAQVSHTAPDPSKQSFLENFLQEGANPAASYGAATRYGFDSVAQGTLDAVKGAASFLNPTAQDDAEKEAFKVAGVGGVLAHRLYKGIEPALVSPAKLAATIHDINQSKDPVGTYLDIAQKTAAQGAGQALTAIGTEGVVKGATAAADAVKGAVASAKPTTISVGDVDVPVRGSVADPGIINTTADALANQSDLADYDVNQTQPAARDALSRLTTRAQHQAFSESLATNADVPDPDAVKAGIKVSNALSGPKVIKPTPAEFLKDGEVDKGIVDGAGLRKALFALKSSGDLEAAGISEGTTQQLQNLGSILERSALKDPTFYNKMGGALGVLTKGVALEAGGALMFGHPMAAVVGATALAAKFGVGKLLGYLVTHPDVIEPTVNIAQAIEGGRVNGTDPNAAVKEVIKKYWESEEGEAGLPGSVPLTPADVKPRLTEAPGTAATSFKGSAPTEEVTPTTNLSTKPPVTEAPGTSATSFKGSSPDDTPTVFDLVKSIQDLREDLAKSGVPVRSAAGGSMNEQPVLNAVQRAKQTSTQTSTPTPEVNKAEVTHVFDPKTQTINPVSTIQEEATPADVNDMVDQMNYTAGRGAVGSPTGTDEGIAQVSAAKAPKQRYYNPETSEANLTTGEKVPLEYMKESDPLGGDVMHVVGGTRGLSVHALEEADKPGVWKISSANSGLKPDLSDVQVGTKAGTAAYEKMFDEAQKAANESGKPVTVTGDDAHKFSMQARRTWENLQDKGKYPVKWENYNPASKITSRDMQRPTITFKPKGK